MPASGHALRPTAVRRLLPLLFIVGGCSTQVDDPAKEDASHTPASNRVEIALPFLEAGARVDMLEPFDAAKTPVILVHGIGGSAADWTELIRRLDRTKYQPWIVIYPRRMAVRDASTLLDGAIDELHRRYRFETSAIVAHSVGGLVALKALNDAVRAGRDPPVSHLITISTPWRGHSAARFARIVPTVPPAAWADLMPDSDFLTDLLSAPRPPELLHTLLFGYGRGMLSWFMLQNNDGIVELDSVLAREVQEQADFVFGFDEDHTDILRSEAVIDLVQERLAAPPRVARPRGTR